MQTDKPAWTGRASLGHRRRGDGSRRHCGFCDLPRHLRDPAGRRSPGLDAGRATARSGVNFIHVWGPPTGVARGIQLGLIALLFGGVPAAIVGWVLAARSSTRARPWSRAWGNAFLAGLVFPVEQPGTHRGPSRSAPLGRHTRATSARGRFCESTAPLLVWNLCGLWGLRCWRVLQHQAQETLVAIWIRD